MIVIDIDWNMLKRVRADTDSRFFHREYPEFIDVYCFLGNVLLRHTFPKKNEMQNLFLAEDLRDSIPIKDIGIINEEQWRDFATRIFDKIEKMENNLEELWQYLRQDGSAIITNSSK